ncbi:MAG TPA: hypothetical protein VNR66_12615 [Solirubrobacteraceae bacterium]|nr:hypothetical protein [Solirubrobacteraceae bacterium]
MIPFVRARGLTMLAAIAMTAGGCGQAGSGAGSAPTSPSRVSDAVPGSNSLGLHAHPQAIEPVAGAASASGAAGASDPSSVSVGPPSRGLAQPVSDTVIRQELAASGLTASSSQATLTANRLAIAPVSAPPQVQAIISAGNQIAHLPYIWGGGHGRYEDTGYDCSGSISFVFAAAGLLNTTLVSGELAHYGLPGPGKWITVFANAGHTFMYVAGLRFDTVALAETGSRWSDRAADEPDLSTFSVRHPAGL